MVTASGWILIADLQLGDLGRVGNEFMEVRRHGLPWFWMAGLVNW